MMTVMFTRSYEILDEMFEKRFKDNYDITNAEQCRQQAIQLATENFESEFEFLDGSIDSFGSYVTNDNKGNFEIFEEIKI
jgi:hypothetical protein